MARRETPEINAGSMADIAFLLLIFFLVTTTMNVDSGISKKLSAKPPPDYKPPVIKEKNIFEVNINRNNDLLVEGEIMVIDDLKEAVKTMDAISLHIPLNDETKNMINLDLLKTMKKNCIIINAARGGIINETDLDKALNDNLIFGAGLDVFEIEPPELNNPLLKNDKVFLSPHTAAFTEECMIRMGKETIQNIIDFFDEKLEKSKTVKL